jgi:hypothetical protein
MSTRFLFQTVSKIKLGIVAFLLITSNSIGLDTVLITKVPIPVDINISQFNFSKSRIFAKSNGTFLWETDHALGQFGIAVKTNLQYFYYRINSFSKTATTNIISQTIQNGIETTIYDEITNETTSYINSESIFKTISPNGVIIYETGSNIESALRFKLTGSRKEMQSRIVLTNFNFKRFIKYNSSGNPVATNNISQDAPINLTYLNEDSPENKTIIFAELKNGFVHFYKVTDPDLLSSPNRITLGSSQNGSLTATVNNPEQTVLNIQSSTNLIDWNTFKTIKNEPSLEIVVPANKPKEFIRAIE